MTRTKRTILLIALMFGLVNQAYGQALTLGVPREQFLNNAGNACAGCKLTTYLAGGTTPQVLYTDSALSVPASNPVIMNSAGRPQVSAVVTTETNLYQPAFNMKFVLTTSGGTAIWTSDNVRPSASGLVLPSTFAVGDILYADTTSTLARLAPGTSGYYLQTNGAGVAPSWTAVTSTVDKSIVQGRLSLTSATPVTTGDVSAATTLYWALYGGNQISLYTGSAWTTVAISQLSITAVGLTASKPYDVFIDYTAGSPALEVVVWTNDTTRATALALQDGVYVQTADADSRYVGTIYIDSGGGAITDSYLLRHVWNYYNRMPRPLRRLESTASWTYTTDTFRQANSSTANQLDIVVGVAEQPITVQIFANARNDAGSPQVEVAVGENSTTTRATGSVNADTQLTAATYAPVTAQLVTVPAVGRTYYTWLEKSAATNTTTWYGVSAPDLQSGMTGMIQG